MSVTAHQQISIAVTDRSCVGEARRLSSQMAERARLKTADRDRVPLIINELASNLLMHAGEGEILISVAPATYGAGIEIIALDRGPGMRDIQKCLADGYSSAGTRGCGLGAVRRLSTAFDIYSSTPGGTAVLSRVRSGDSISSSELQFSAISVPAPHETECGDGWSLRCGKNHSAAIVVDGLGHGPIAALATAEALRLFDEHSFDTPVGYLEAAHVALRSSRGAAIGRADIGPSHQLHFAGVGNITASIICAEGRTQSLVSHNGIVGAQMRKLQQFDYGWNNGDLLIMHSDGMSARWKLNDYPGLIAADTSVIAAILYRDCKRGRDDTTVLVTRLNGN